jgi:hypothetical protein
MNYHVEIEVPLEDIDCVTQGVDCQSVCIHTKTQRFKALTSDHEQKQFSVETASLALGECIASTIQQTVKKFTRKHNEIEVGSGLTMYSLILRNFIRREMGLPSVELRHGVLVYWLQNVADNPSSANSLEGYLFTRNFYPKAWRRKADKWSQGYFVLRGSMLYHFKDFTCKVAEFSLNIR